MRKPWLAVVWFAPMCFAQWLEYPTPGLPRTKDGKVDLTAQAPKTSDGKPDLSGVWHVQGITDEENTRLGLGPDVFQVQGMERFTVSKYIAGGFLQDYAPGAIVRTPAAAAAVRATRQVRTTPCLPLGMPTAVLLSEFHKVIQTPNLTLILLELDSQWRQIYTDGRPLPNDPNPSWQGYSIGHWEKDTLVVETIGFNGKTLIPSGIPVSPAMKMTERYTRRDVGHLDVEMTFEDPAMYSPPITIRVTHLLQPDTDILEYVCVENEKDRVHMR